MKGVRHKISWQMQLFVITDSLTKVSQVMIYKSFYFIGFTFLTSI